MTKEQLIELVRFTSGEIVAPTELSVEDAESIVDDFVDKEQLTIPVVVGQSEQLVCYKKCGDTQPYNDICLNCGSSVNYNAS